MPDSAGNFIFGTKAETLERLAPLLSSSNVPQLLHFPVAEWRGDNRGGIVADIADAFHGLPVIVRSSALAEDGMLTAQAGAFLSLPNIPSGDGGAVEKAVDSVVSSYEKVVQSAEDSGANRVLVQRMISNALVSGVLFTQELNTGAPYYVINYDDETGSTESITAGTGYNNRTLYVFRDKWSQLTSPRFRAILKAVTEIEELVGDDCLDIEFALDADFVVNIFQVRRITTQPNWNRGLSLKIGDALSRLEEGVAERYGSNRTGQAGEMGGAILGNMPDWNPAEMIGTTPRPMAFSLYRRLITDRAWRVARRIMGYRERAGVPLMISLAGQPYIDVRESFWSFTPADLDEAIAEKLVSAWLSRLRENHHLHDKVEFDIAVTAFSPDLDLRVEAQFPGVLDSEENGAFRDSSRRLTNNLLTRRTAPIAEQLALLENLSRRRETLAHAAASPAHDAISALLEDAVHYGTVPFSILARHGFIATSMLRGLVNRSVLDAGEIDRFMQSVPTVATRFIVDLDRHARGEIGKEEFLARYGHLRPGTYDILSLRYDQRMANTDLTSVERNANLKEHEAGFDIPNRNDIDLLLRSEGIEAGAADLFDYCKAAIQGREYAKFVFTHNVSSALETIAALGERYRLSREELSFVDIDSFLNSFIELRGRSLESHLRNLSEEGRRAHEVTTAIRLPSLVTSLSDLFIVPLMVEHPNFVTRKNIRGPVVRLDETNLDPACIDNRIVAIESADPGFDWIFSRPILGLVTKFGGANSHMAIRCAEFSLPAAIGCGEQIFERVADAGAIELNCADGQVIICPEHGY